MRPVCKTSVHTGLFKVKIVTVLHRPRLDLKILQRKIIKGPSRGLYSTTSELRVHLIIVLEGLEYHQTNNLIRRETQDVFRVLN